MNILIISGGKGGVYVFTIKLAKYLLEKGHKVHVIFLTGNERRLRPLPSNVSFNFINSPLGILGLFSLLRANFDVIHLNLALPGILLPIFRVQAIFTAHGVPQPSLEVSILDKILYYMEKLILPFVGKRVCAVTSVSNFVQRELKKVYNINSIVIYHGIDATHFPYIPYSQKRVHKKALGLNEREKLVLYVGRFHPYKDPMTLIRAFKLVETKKPETRLIMIGQGELYAQILSLIDRLHLHSKVNLLTYVEFCDLQSYFCAADVFVMPSVNEAFGMTLLESMASGTPCIAADSGACPEVLGPAGLLFTMGDHVDLSKKILTLLNDEKLAEFLSYEARKRVETLFLLSDKLESYEKLYCVISCVGRKNIVRSRSLTF